MQKGHMLVYVPKIFENFEKIQDSSEISMPELFLKASSEFGLLEAIAN
jgi:hypothetical protein